MSQESANRVLNVPQSLLAEYIEWMNYQNTEIICKYWWFCKIFILIDGFESLNLVNRQGNFLEAQDLCAVAPFTNMV